MAARIEIKFYSKPNCPLCDKVEALLEAARGRWPLVVNKVNIMADNNLYDRYRNSIPVLQFADGRELQPPITRERLTTTLRSCHLGADARGEG